jgi:hypothetical protein
MLMDRAAEVSHQFAAWEAAAQDFIAAEVWAMADIRAQRDTEAAAKHAAHWWRTAASNA